MEKKIVIIGANSFIGKNLVKEIGEKRCIQLSSTKKNNLINFNLGDDLNTLIKYPDEVEKIILLSWDRRNIKKGGKNINIFGIEKIYEYAKEKGIPIFFASSVSAISKVSLYGMNKFLCENILKENENNRILRLGMVLSENGGLIYKINKIFSKLPIIFVPGNGNFKVNFVKVETVIKKFLLNPDNLSQTENIVDLNEKFINFLVTKNKLKLYVPHILTKFILFIFTKVFKINSSFTYDGYLSLINDPNEIEIGSNE